MFATLRSHHFRKSRRRLTAFLLAASAGAVCSGATTNIYQWEWVDPSNHAAGKKQSNVVAPGGYAALSSGTYANLNNRNLTQAYLIGANLSYASLYSTNLTIADLSGANLRYATGDNTVFAGATMVGADLTQFSLGTPTFAGADLTGAQLTNGSLRNPNLSGATLASASMSGLMLVNADLSHADLTGALCNGMRLYGATFSGATLRGAKLEHCDLWSGVQFDAADLRGASLRGSSGFYVDLTGADLRGADLTEMSILSGTWIGTNLSGATIRGAALLGTGLTAAQVYSTASYQAHDLGGVSLGPDLRNWNLAGQDLTGASLGSDLTRTDLSGARIDRARFISVTGLTAQQIYSTVTYQSRNMQHMYFNHDDLSGWDLTNQNLAGTVFGGADLTDANLSGADISGANFEKFGSLSPAQLYSTASYQAHDLRGIILSLNDLSGFDFSGQNLTGASFLGSSLGGATFTGATISGANFMHILTMGGGIPAATLYSTASYRDHDLRNVDFSINNLRSFDFSNQNLSGSTFLNATLTAANFTGATINNVDFSTTSTAATGFTATQLYSTASYHNHDLRGVRLWPMNMQGWDFSGQDLTGAQLNGTFTGANFTGATLTGARLGGTTMTAEQISSTASYRRRDMRGIWISFAELHGWDLSRQNLAGASFFNTKFDGVSLAGANLQNSYFNSISGSADFTGADLRGSRPASYGPGGSNTISPTGYVGYFNIQPGETFTVRDYEPAPPDASLPPSVSWGPPPDVPHGITVNGYQMHFDPAGTISVLFRDADWSSTLIFGYRPTPIDGTLLLGFDDGVDVDALLGQSWQVFDWRGIIPTGAFDVRSADPGWQWDTSALYTSGFVTLIAVDGRVAVPEPYLLPLALLAPLLAPLRGGRRAQTTGQLNSFG